MHYMYELADDNALVRRVYEDRFQNKNIPDARTVTIRI